jgi:hypothetical protein
MFKSISGRSGVLYSLSRTPFTIQEHFQFECVGMQMREMSLARLAAYTEVRESRKSPKRFSVSKGVPKALYLMLFTNHVNAQCALGQGKRNDKADALHTFKLKLL